MALVAHMNYDFSRIRLLHLNEANKLVIILRNRELDRYARDFLVRDLPVGTPTWKALYHCACNAAEGRNATVESWGLKRLAVYGLPRLSTPIGYRLPSASFSPFIIQPFVPINPSSTPFHYPTRRLLLRRPVSHLFKLVKRVSR